MMQLRHKARIVNLSQTRSKRMSSFAGISKLSLHNSLRHCAAGVALLCAAGSVSPVAVAQDGAHDPANYAWQAGAIRHTQRMRAFVDPDSGQQPTPPVIPQFEI